MKTADLLIAANTVWVVVAAILVMFMQAGFAFLEAGLTRMKNAAHIAGKNVLIFGICSLVYWAVGFGLAFGDGNAIVGTSGFFPSVRRPPGDRHGAVQLLRLDSGGRRLPLRSRFRRRLARDRLGRHGRAREALGLLRLRRRLHRHLLRHLALDLARRRLALRPWHAGLRRLDGRPLPGRARRARGGAPPRAQDRQVRHRWQGEPDPGPQRAFRRPRHDHPLVRLVRLQPGLDPRRGHGRQDRLLRLRRPDDEPRRRGGRARGHRSPPGSCSRSRTSR